MSIWENVKPSLETVKPSDNNALKKITKLEKITETIKKLFHLFLSVHLYLITPPSLSQIKDRQPLSRPDSMPFICNI
jgi:hypothetical protein